MGILANKFCPMIPIILVTVSWAKILTHVWPVAWEVAEQESWPNRYFQIECLTGQPS